MVEGERDKAKEGFIVEKSWADVAEAALKKNEASLEEIGKNLWTKMAQL